MGIDAPQLIFGLATMLVGALLGIVGNYYFQRRMAESERARAREKKGLETLLQSDDLRLRIVQSLGKVG